MADSIDTSEKNVVLTPLNIPFSDCNIPYGLGDRIDPT